MSDPTVDLLRFPLGRFQWSGALSADQRRQDMTILSETPARLRQAVANLTNEQLDTPYRDGGWTVRQVVHHVPDSHLNAYVRFRLTLTEDQPLVKTYDEAAWANLSDARTAPLEPSLSLLDAIHTRWVLLLRDLAPEDFQRVFRHPEYSEARPLDWLLHLYAWHGPHHVAHITGLKERRGW
jgi:uncharacterized damage-inducible protein DinB